MRSYLNQITLNVIMLFLTTLHAQAAHSIPPVVSINTQGLQATLHWSKNNKAAGYRLFYAPYPYQGEESISSVDLGNNTNFSIKLWQKATYFVAIQSYDANNKSSEYSNIGFVQIQDRGSEYDYFWETVIKEITDKQFISDDYLYSQLPNSETCFEGSINVSVKTRSLNTLNQIRNLHHLPAVQYDTTSDIETQKAALIQHANNFLVHTPPKNSKCFSQTGLDGSNSSNLSLAHDNKDPANDLIGLIDDAFNISSVGGVGHRRHLLNPFLQFTSYGQVYGASSVKVFDFSNSIDSTSTDIPSFVAFPYLRYPYIFFSDKISDKKTPWNLSIIEDNISQWGNLHDYFSESTVSVTQKSNNQQLIIHDLFSDTNKVGIPNNLSWMVDEWQYDTWYTVSIDNINYQSGEISSIEYDVFIDYKNFFHLDFPLEKDDIQTKKNSINGKLLDVDDKDKFEVKLSGNISFIGKSQFSNTAFFIEVYNSDKQLLQISDKPFSLNLPNNIYTLVVSSCYNLSCYKGMKKYNIEIETQ
ncbi:MAG: hypothetical protein KAH20_09255 [Methylococcales bacterium]|nr:hypothetical protein [Methylococcales bacterium]